MMIEMANIGFLLERRIDMVPTLSTGWNVFLVIAVVVCAVILVINVRKESQIRKEAQQEVSQTPPDLPEK